MIHPPFTAATWENLPRGTKLLRRDGKYKTFLVWTPEAAASFQVILLTPEGHPTGRFSSGKFGERGDSPLDIIGIIQPVTLPEFWVVRWADGAMVVHPECPDEMQTAGYWDREFPAFAPHYVEHHSARVVE